MKWEMVNLNKVCNPKQWKTLSMSDLQPSGYPVYGANSKIGYYSEYTHEMPTLMITCRGATCGNVHISEPFSYINGNAMALDDMEKGIDIKFLYYYFLKRGFKDVISGSAQPQITRQGLEQVHIPLPPLSTQRRIAEILDKADALRQKDQALLQKYDELAQAVFVDMFGDPVKNEKGWEVRRLGDLLLPGEKITYGVVQPGDDYPNGVPIIRVGDFKSLKIEKAKLKKINPEIEKKHSKTRLNGDEILIACVGSIGKIALADDTLKGFNIVRATAKVRVDNAMINRTYLAMQLTQRSIQDYFISETRTSSQPTLNIKQIEETNILIPPITLQEKFEDISLKLLSQIEIVEQFHSESLFQSLLQKAFTGELVS
jgi:type I restriction enzyme S subunit